MKIDDLCKKIKETNCPVCVGLDTSCEYLNEEYRSKADVSDSEISKCIYRFNCDIIDSVKDVVPCVKVQAAYYEQYGYHGVKCFYDTMQYASEAGLTVIADVKRNDIGSTAKAYSKAYLLGSAADFITVNAYLGIDGIAPFIEDCEATGKGIFVLVKTSNPSGGELQDLEIDGKTLYSIVGEKVSQWGSGLVGEYGYSSIGAVVGATYPQQAQDLREKHKSTFFLVPGYGAQGAGADDIAVNFDKGGLGAVVNSSRGILLAYRKDGFCSQPATAAREAAVAMKDDINAALLRRG
jgi:orotidine-5'-phosphate decarboxylase